MKNKKERKIKKGSKRLMILIPLDLITKLIILFTPHNLIVLALVFLGITKIETAAIIFLVENIIISLINLYLYEASLKGEEFKSKYTYFMYVLISSIVIIYCEIVHFIKVTG